MFNFAAAFYAAFMLLSAGPVYAATDVTTSPVAEQPAIERSDETPEELNDNISFPVWPKISVELQGSDAVPIQFRLGSISGIDPSLLSGVTANGFTRKVEAEGESVAQVLITTVSKDGKEAALSEKGLSAQFDARDTNELFPEKDIEVEGSRAELIAALESLNGKEEKDEEEKVATSTSVGDGGVSSSGSSNDEASSYSSPKTAAAIKPDPVEDYRLSEDGCKVRVDFSRELAIQQNKTQTFLDNALSSESNCEDSNKNYPLKKSYLACDDIVDLDAKKAWAQFNWYYTDGSGETHTVSECTKDEEKVFDITEDEGQCSISLDYDAKTAIPQSALVYLDKNNKLTVARDCQDSSTAEVLPMTESTDTCPLRHKYTEGKSYELSMWTYIRNGVTYQAMPCTDTGRKFAHQTVYQTKSGEYVCSPITNLDAKTVTFQSRKQITIDGISEFVSECTPDTNNSPIMATTDGCTDASKWTHDIAASTSYGQERFYYLKGGTERVYVTSCQTSAKTYSHNHEITGYQHHDDQLFSYPLTTVYINLDDGSRYNIKTSEVLQGAVQFPYVPDGSTDVQNGEVKYEGCNAFYATDRSKKYKREDDTFFFKPIGDGEPTGPQDVCIKKDQNASYWQVDVYGGIFNHIYGTKCLKDECGSAQEQKIFITRTIKTNPYTNQVFTEEPRITGASYFQRAAFIPGSGGPCSAHFIGKYITSKQIDMDYYHVFACELESNLHPWALPANSKVIFNKKIYEGRYKYQIRTNYSPKKAIDW